MKTPITYWGGKQQLAQTILKLIPDHKQYNEPFFGGGAIFFAKKPAEVEFINDINGEMINFYRTLKLDFDQLKTEIDCTLHSEFQHKQAKGIYTSPLDHNSIMRAWAVWMLSHQSVYAILTNTWSVSIDKNKAKQIQNLKEFFTIQYARRLERTSIFCRDAFVFRKFGIFVFFENCLAMLVELDFESIACFDSRNENGISTNICLFQIL